MSVERYEVTWTCEHCKVTVPCSVEIDSEVINLKAPLSRPAYVAAEKVAARNLLANSHICPPVLPG